MDIILQKSSLFTVKGAVLLFLGLLFTFFNLNGQPTRDSLAPCWGKQASPYSFDITTLKVDSNNVIYMGMWGNGLKKSNNGGFSWSTMNTGLTNLYITGFDIDSTGAYYAATFGGGVFRSSNNGITWSAVNKGITNLRVKAIVCKKGGPIFIGTLGGGIFRSVNGGTNWQQVNAGLSFWDINTFVLTLEGYVLAGTNGDGIYRSEDNGDTWRRSNGALTSKTVTSFCLNDAGEIYCGTLGGGLNFSVNAGVSWTEYIASSTVKNISCVSYYTNDEPVCGLSDWGIWKYDSQLYLTWRKSDYSISGINCIVRDKNKNFFAGIPYLGLYKSTDGGMSWKAASPSFAIDTGVTPIFAGPNGLIFASNRFGALYRSTNYGNSWDSTAFNNPTIVNAFAFDSLGNAYASVTVDSADTGYGRLLTSTDNGSTWTRILQMKDTVIKNIGMKANGIWLLGVQFKPATIPPPEGTPTSEIMRTQNYGLTWSHVAATSPTEGFRFIKFNPRGDAFTVESTGVMRSIDNGATWNKILDQSVTNCYDIGFNSQNWIFAATDNGVYKSINNGGAWTFNKLGFQYPSVGYVLVTPDDNIYIAMKGQNGVFYSIDGGVKYDSINTHIIRSKPGGLTRSTDGMIYLSTTKIYRSIEPPDLVPPTLVSPKDMQGGVPLSPTLVWNTATKAEMYEVQVSVFMDFNNVLIDVTIGDTARTLSTTLDYNQTYFWRVRSRTNNSLSDWSAFNEFTTIIKYPILVSPVNDSANIPTTVTLYWHKVDGAGLYTVVVSKFPGFDTLFVQKQQTDTSFKLTGLSLYTKYYWKVQAQANKTFSDWSEVWDFTTRLNIPTLKAPLNKSYIWDTVATLEWNPTAGATGYEVDIAKDSLFQNIIFEGETQTLQSHKTKLLEYFTKYWWRIRAKNDDGVGDWSNAWWFITVIEPVSLVLPYDNTSDMRHDSVYFEWAQDAKAQFYDFQLSKDQDFATIFYEDSSLKDVKLTLNNFDYYTQYFWRARILIKPYQGLWSETRSFMTGISTPILQFPTNKADSANRDIIFSWDPVTGADNYTLEVSSDSTFPSFILKQDSIEVPRFEYSFDYETVYYWKVKAIYDVGQSFWSVVWSFKTEPKLDVIDMINGVTAKVYPNPFSSYVNFNLTLQSDAHVRISVIDLNGSEISIVFDDEMQSGTNDFKWTPNNLSQGSYLYKISVDNRNYYGTINYIR